MLLGDPICWEQHLLREDSIHDICHVRSLQGRYGGLVMTSMSQRSHSVTLMRIRILKVHTASAAFGRLRYSQQLCVQVRQRWKSEPYLVTRSLSEVLDRDWTERWPASFSLTADLCLQPSLQSPWQGKAEPVRQRSRGFRLKKSETKIEGYNCSGQTGAI